MSSWQVFFRPRRDGFAGIETALRLSPHDPHVPWWQFYMCAFHTNLAQWEQAIPWCNKAVAGLPDVFIPILFLASANAWAGHDKEAKDAAAHLQKVYPGFTVQTWVGMHWSDDPTFNSRHERRSKVCARRAFRRARRRPMNRRDRKRASVRITNQPPFYCAKPNGNGSETRNNTIELRPGRHRWRPDLASASLQAFSVRIGEGPDGRNVGARFEASVRWHFLAKTRNTGYRYFANNRSWDSWRRNGCCSLFEPSACNPERELRGGRDFFIWIRCNPLKSPDSAKGIQGNARLFPWFSLDSFGFIWPEFASWLNPSRRAQASAGGIRLGRRPAGKRLFSRSIWSGGTRTVRWSPPSSSRRFMTSACS